LSTIGAKLAGKNEATFVSGIPLSIVATIRALDARFELSAFTKSSAVDSLVGFVFKRTEIWLPLTVIVGAPTDPWLVLVRLIVMPFSSAPKRTAANLTITASFVAKFEVVEAASSRGRFELTVKTAARDLDAAGIVPQVVG